MGKHYYGINYQTLGILYYKSISYIDNITKENFNNLFDIYPTIYIYIFIYL